LACQIRSTVVSLTPAFLASVRVLQCRSFGPGLRRQAHDLSSIDARPAPTARQVIFYRRDAALNKAFAPASHLDSPDPQRGGDLPIAHTIGRQQHDLCSSHCSYLEGLRSHHPFKLDALFAAQFNRSRRLHDSLHRRYKEHDNGKTHWFR
jgi:hypothetical protein